MIFRRIQPKDLLRHRAYKWVKEKPLKAVSENPVKTLGIAASLGYVAHNRLQLRLKFGFVCPHSASIDRPQWEKRMRGQLSKWMSNDSTDTQKGTSGDISKFHDGIKVKFEAILPVLDQVLVKVHPLQGSRVYSKLMDANVIDDMIDETTKESLKGKRYNTIWMEVRGHDNYVFPADQGIDSHDSKNLREQFARWLDKRAWWESKEKFNIINPIHRVGEMAPVKVPIERIRKMTHLVHVTDKKIVIRIDAELGDEVHMDIMLADPTKIFKFSEASI